MARAQGKGSAPVSSPLHLAPPAWLPQRPACRPSMRWAAATEDGLAQDLHTWTPFRGGPLKCCVFPEHRTVYKMDWKAKQRSSQPSKKKETKIRQNNRGMNKLTIERERRETERRRGLGFQKPKLLYNKGNYKQGAKTALRLGENNSKRSNRQRINLKNIQATPEAQFQKNKWPNQKMGQRAKQTFLQRRHTDG